MDTSSPLHVPDELVASHLDHNGAAGRAWVAALPGLVASFLDRWALRLDGPAKHGMVVLVLPVLRADGTPAALKLQPVDEESVGEPIALRTSGSVGHGRDEVGHSLTGGSEIRILAHAGTDGQAGRISSD